MMPVLDGWEVAETLLADEETRGIPIIFLTARADLRDQARGLDLGGIDYVTKPFNPAELAAVVRRAVSREGEELQAARIAELRTLFSG